MAIGCNKGGFKMDKKIVTIGFPQDEYEMVKYLAYREGRTISKQIRYIVREQLKRETIPNIK
jgi:hypothetical protein